MKCPLLSGGEDCLVYDGGVPDTCNPGDKVCLAAISAYYLGKHADVDERLKQIRYRNVEETEYMLNRAIALGEERERMRQQILQFPLHSDMEDGS